MFPWVYGFVWNAGNIIFLSIFFSVVIIILATLTIAVLRALTDFMSNKADRIRWHDDFEELPFGARICRHVLTGEIKSRTCTNGFDCRTCELHPRLTALSRSAAGNSMADKDRRTSTFGLDMPADRLYHRGHTWVKQESDGTLTVGLDSFAKKLIGKPDGVELPTVGEILQVNGTALCIQKGSARVRILSPVDGRVAAIASAGAAIRITIQPRETPDLRHLLHGDEVRPWVLREMERLELAFCGENIGLSLADGGELTDNLIENYPEANWDNLLGEMFLEP